MDAETQPAADLVSQPFAGASDAHPYVPAWCYENGARECRCGHHEGHHNDAGECKHAAGCGCAGLTEVEQPAA